LRKKVSHKHGVFIAQVQLLLLKIILLRLKVRCVKKQSPVNVA